jgi:hypothetical protein
MRARRPTRAAGTGTGARNGDVARLPGSPPTALRPTRSERPADLASGPGRPDRGVGARAAPSSRQAEDAAGLLVTGFQIERHREDLGQRQQQRRQRLAEGQGGPRAEVRWGRGSIHRGDAHGIRRSERWASRRPAALDPPYTPRVHARGPAPGRKRARPGRVPSRTRPGRLDHPRRSRVAHQ